MSISLYFADQKILWDGHLLVELTKRCNYECLHCFTNASPVVRGPEPTIDNILALLRSAREIDFRSATLTGGELLLRHDIDDLIEALPDDMEIWLFTSGFRLDIKMLERWRHFVTGYVVSLDGGRKQHNTLRRSATSFDDIIGFLKLLSKIGVRVQIQSMVLRNQISHLEAMVELAEVLGVERILFSHVSPEGRGASFLDGQMDTVDLDALQERVSHLQKRTPVLLHTNLMPRNLIEQRFPKPVLHVLPNGSLVPWFGIGSEFSLGNLNKWNWDLKEMIRSQPFPARIDQVFCRARSKASCYPGKAVPVDDLVLREFIGGRQCV